MKQGFEGEDPRRFQNINATLVCRHWKISSTFTHAQVVIQSRI